MKEKLYIHWPCNCYRGNTFTDLVTVKEKTYSLTKWLLKRKYIHWKHSVTLTQRMIQSTHVSPIYPANKSDGQTTENWSLCLSLFMQMTPKSANCQFYGRIISLPSRPLSCGVTLQTDIGICHMSPAMHTPFLCCDGWSQIITSVTKQAGVKSN